ncbi:Serine/threonine-protein kinase Chk1 [Aphelenchoides avenae]|nr:Serine/threonine-protein kinase Chk1 [Aphelenchus avenae]
MVSLGKYANEGSNESDFVTITKIEGRAIPGISFSQPDNAHALLLTTQFLASQDYAQSIRTNVLQKMVRRMTRFFVTLPVSEAVKAVKAAVVVTVYKMYEVSFEKVLVDLRRSKGDGLEFKQMFLALRGELNHVICKGSSDCHEAQSFFCAQDLDALRLSDNTGNSVREYTP